MAREIRILHTADTHLGYRQYHSEVRRKDFFAAFEVVVNDAIEMQVDAVVHAGDLFDSRNPTLEDLLETMNILSRLKAAGIPFFGIVGNHESKQNTQWLDLFEEMGLAARLGKKPLMVGNAAIYGIDSVPKSKIPLFDYLGFEAPDSSSSPFSSSPPLPENFWKLLVMHQIMHPFPYAEWDCAEVLEKFPLKIDAILLGDYHKYEKIKVGDAWVTYPGSTERNSASEEEHATFLHRRSGPSRRPSRRRGRTRPRRSVSPGRSTSCRRSSPTCSRVPESGPVWGAAPGSGRLAGCTRRTSGPLSADIRRVPLHRLRQPHAIRTPQDPRRTRSSCHRGCQDQAQAHRQDA